MWGPTKGRGPRNYHLLPPFSVGLAVISGSLLQSNLCRDRDVALYTYSNCDGDPLIPSSFNSFLVDPYITLHFLKCFFTLVLLIVKCIKDLTRLLDKRGKELKTWQKQLLMIF